ncbi:unnamed protein product [Mycena citricolor]|uniref:Uncharacterized protein n=1 Tax=Mycena citricolor TaxID=2018698 RepID=A0AAD2HAI0_9AGAR|nr:unnamed protein product [Mycena citricolor]
MRKSGVIMQSHRPMLRCLSSHAQLLPLAVRRNSPLPPPQVRHRAAGRSLLRAWDLLAVGAGSILRTVLGGSLTTDIDAVLTRDRPRGAGLTGMRVWRYDAVSQTHF